MYNRWKILYVSFEKVFDRKSSMISLHATASLTILLKKGLGRRKFQYFWNPWKYWVPDLVTRCFPFIPRNCSFGQMASDLSSNVRHETFAYYESRGPKSVILLWCLLVLDALVHTIWSDTCISRSRCRWLSIKCSQYLNKITEEWKLYFRLKLNTLVHLLYFHFFLNTGAI